MILASKIPQTALILLIIALLLAGCAGIYYDRTWPYIQPGTRLKPWNEPHQLRVVIADLETVSKACYKLGARYYYPGLLPGCYDLRTGIIWSIPDWQNILHELEHVWSGYTHAQPGFP